MKNKKIYCLIIAYSLLFFGLCKTDSMYERERAICFDGAALYPISDIQRARNAATQAYDSVRDAIMLYEQRIRFEQNIHSFTNLILTINSYAQVIVDKLQQLPLEHQQISAKEICTLDKTVGKIESYFDLVMMGKSSDQASCCKVVLRNIQKKLEQILT